MKAGEQMKPVERIGMAVIDNSTYIPFYSLTASTAQVGCTYTRRIFDANYSIL